MGKFLEYGAELSKAMTLLAQDNRTIFLGQGLLYHANAMFPTFTNVPKEKCIEMPVAEDMQMGISIGLSLKGYLPISIYPRMDFLVIASNQLANHLDKIKEMSVGRYCPKVIIRTAIGSRTPLYPGPQHCQDYTDSLRRLLKNIALIKLFTAEQIVASYEWALRRDGSSILVEIGGAY